MTYLTKPLKVGDTGPKVKGAQWLLSGHNKFHIQTYRGKLDGIFGKGMAKAVISMKYQLGYANSGGPAFFGNTLFDYLTGKKRRTPAMVLRAKLRARKLLKKKSYPLAKHGRLIGFPGMGTHSWVWPPNNWESDNAVDIQIPTGTPVLAYRDGQIGAQIGPLPETDPRFHGNRLHLHTTDGNEFYYAHLVKLSVHAHQTVKAGQVLGYSGEANGVAHLH